MKIKNASSVIIIPGWQQWAYSACRVAMSLYFAVKIITRGYATDSTYCIQATFLKKNRDTRLEKKGGRISFSYFEYIYDVKYLMLWYKALQ
jgi:hypothetical protein